jgi:hypothetical protein
VGVKFAIAVAGVLKASSLLAALDLSGECVDGLGLHAGTSRDVLADIMSRRLIAASDASGSAIGAEGASALAGADEALSRLASLEFAGELAVACRLALLSLCSVFVSFCVGRTVQPTKGCVALRCVWLRLAATSL